MTDELLNCPFCGETEHVTEKEGGKYRYLCLGCGATGPVTETLSTVLEAWNTRAHGGEVSLVTSIFMGFWGGFYDVWTATKK